MSNTQVSGCGRALSGAAVLAGWLALAPASVGAVYEVGPGQAYPTVSAVPWESLAAGDTVRIHWRAEPYREKWVIAAQGTALQPITVQGVAGPGGALPVIDGNGATTRLQLNFWSEGRGIIKIGGSNVPADVVPRHVVIESLALRSARPPYGFTDESGASDTYPDNAAAIFVEKGENITIRSCVVHDCGNGIFVASSDDEVSRDILIEGNFIFDNGNAGSIYEHNAYTAGIGMTYQFNRFGPLRDGAGGNNLKDRSAGLVVRYNWIEGGNRQLDLVDAEDSVQILADPSYRHTYAYGNILIEPDGAGNKQVLHYGGDSGQAAIYRKGLLHFFHNTVVSTRTTSTTLMRLSTNEESADARNNIVWVTAGGSTLSLLDSSGSLVIRRNLFRPGWAAASGSLTGTLDDDGSTVPATVSPFLNLAGTDYHLRPGSPASDSGGPLNPQALPRHEVAAQYVLHQDRGVRPVWGAAPDLGAFEYVAGDTNGDGAVSLADYAIWDSCATPPGSSAIPASCRVLDFDGDGDVDLGDFADLQAVVD